MLEGLLGSINVERVLIFIFCRDEGYAREISKFYQIDLSPIQNQLKRLENNGILVSKNVGKTRVFSLNLRYSFLKELKSLLEKALSFYPEDLKESLLNFRRRPRRTGKPK